MTATPPYDSRLTVLLVDDEPPIIRIAARMLAPLGCEILTATSGPEALALYAARGGPIELLLTDLHMPRMNGRALAAALRAIQPGLKVLYCTGRSDDLFAQQSELGPHEAFIDKPVTAAALCQAVSLQLFGTLVPPGAANAQPYQADGASV